VHLKAVAPKIELEMDLILHTDLVEKQFFVMPLNSDGTHYYVNNKANGVPITGTYSFEGKDYACVYEHASRCHALMDSGRGRFNYYTSWVWGTLLTTIPDTKEVFTVNLIYGFGGTGQTPETKFSEDFLTIDGKHYKLDQTQIIEFVPGDLKKTHFFRTVNVEDRVYPKRGCELHFTPFSDGDQSKDGGGFSVMTFT
jgi:hypothetical protein